MRLTEAILLAGNLGYAIIIIIIIIHFLGPKYSPQDPIFKYP